MAANVLIMAGGTGGHVFPALACAREFKARGYAVHWLGTPRGIENELVPKRPVCRCNVFRSAACAARASWRCSRRRCSCCVALWQARKIVRELQPVCVLGMGGYVTGPGGLAARLAGVPLMIHEQNAVAGTANRSLAPLPARVCEAFPGHLRPAASAAPPVIRYARSCFWTPRAAPCAIAAAAPAGAGRQPGCRTAQPPAARCAGLLAGRAAPAGVPPGRQAARRGDGERYQAPGRERRSGCRSSRTWPRLWPGPTW